MSLDSIKGYIEINGVRYDAKEIIKKLQEQGITIGVDRGLLFLGKEVIRPSTSEESNSEVCPFISACKIYDQFKNKLQNKKERNDTSKASNHVSTMVEPPIIKSNPQFAIHNDVIPLNNKEIVIPLQQERKEMDLTLDFPQQPSYDTSRVNEPVFMKALNPETKYIPSITKSAYKTNKSVKAIPLHLQTICPYCFKIVSKEWTFCGHCGRQLKKGQK